MKRSAKDILAFAASALLCGFAVWRQLQFVAISGFIGVLCVIYKSQTLQLSKICFDLLGRFTRAKYRDLEIEVGSDVVNIRLAAEAPKWMRSIITAMKPGHVGILLAIEKYEEFNISGAMLTQLRDLRNLGLVEHDKPTIGESSRVWLSDTGRAVTNYLKGEEPIAKPVTQKTKLLEE